MGHTQTLRISLLFLGTIVFFLAILENRIEGYCCMALISLYIYIYWNIIGIYKYSNTVCGFFILLLTSVRFFIIPLMIIIDDGYMTYRPLGLGMNSTFFYQGVSMTAWELIIFACFIYRKLPRWYEGTNEKIDIEDTTNISLWIIIIVAFSGMIFINMSALSDYSFVLDLKIDDTIGKEYVPKGLTETISTIASRVLKIIIPIPFAYYFYKRYESTQSISNFYLSTIIFVFFYAFIIEGNSRNSIIIPAVATMFILLRLYPQYKKGTLSALISVIIMITVLSLIWKSFSGNYAAVRNSSFSYWISYIESYFAGISNMGKAVYAYQNSDIIINPMIAFNDITRNIPFLNLLTDNTNTASHYFVTIWGRKDQVIPASGNGLFYFGYIFAPIVPILTLTLAHYFESRMQKSSSIAEIIVFCYSSTVISYNIFNSVSTMMMKLSITLLPLLLCLYFSRKIKLTI